MHKETIRIYVEREEYNKALPYLHWWAMSGVVNKGDEISSLLLLLLVAFRCSEKQWRCWFAIVLELRSFHPRSPAVTEALSVPAFSAKPIVDDLQRWLDRSFWKSTYRRCKPTPCVPIHFHYVHIMFIMCIHIKFLCTLTHSFPFSALTLSVGQQEEYPACKKLDVRLLMVMIWLELCTSYSSSCHHHLHHP